METQVQTTPVTTAETPAPRPHRLQSRSHAERIARAEATIRRAQAQSELNERLAAHGFTAERLAEGNALCHAAQDAFTARQQALGAQRAAVQAADDAMSNARDHFADFRVRVRRAVKTPAVHTFLDLGTSVPWDTAGFTYMAQTTYTTAQRTPALQPLLEELGYDAEALNGLLTELDALGARVQQADEARAAAVHATLERERTIAALDRWIRILRAVARPATRGRPDLKMQLGM